MKNFNEQQLFSSLGHPSRNVRRSIRQSDQMKQDTQQQFSKNHQQSISTNISCNTSLCCSLGKNKMKQLDQYDIFKCHNCELKADGNCQVCGGQIELSGKSNMVKFMEYIMEFKMDLKDSYVCENMKNKSKNQPNAWCTDVISNSNMRSTDLGNPRMSQGAYNNKLYQSSLVNKCEQVDAHNGYQCDNCKCQPIKGTRYHCKTCQNYDLCSKCFESDGHQHEMNKIQSSLLYSSISGILQKLNKQAKMNELKLSSNERKFGKDLLKPLGTSSIYKSSIR